MVDINTYFKLLRVRDWPVLFLISLLGFMLSDWFFYPPLTWALFFLILALSLGFGFSINNCFDSEEDKLGKKRKFDCKRKN